MPDECTSFAFAETFSVSAGLSSVPVEFSCKKSEVNSDIQYTKIIAKIL